VRCPSMLPLLPLVLSLAHEGSLHRRPPAGRDWQPNQLYTRLTDDWLARKTQLDSAMQVRPWTMECGLWTVDCDCGLWTVDCGLWPLGSFLMALGLLAF
jgi:hypothetical protein